MIKFLYIGWFIGFEDVRDILFGKDVYGICCSCF